MRIYFSSLFMCVGSFCFRICQFLITFRWVLQEYDTKNFTNLIFLADFYFTTYCQTISFAGYNKKALISNMHACSSQKFLFSFKWMKKKKKSQIKIFFISISVRLIWNFDDLWMKDVKLWLNSYLRQSADWCLRDFYSKFDEKYTIKFTNLRQKISSFSRETKTQDNFFLQDCYDQISDFNLFITQNLRDLSNFQWIYNNSASTAAKNFYEPFIFTKWFQLSARKFQNNLQWDRKCKGTVTTKRFLLSRVFFEFFFILFSFLLALLLCCLF